MTPITSARARLVDALRRLEAAHLANATPADKTQLGSIFIMAARQYATQIAVSVPGLPNEPPGRRPGEPDGCVNPDRSECERTGNCYYLDCPNRTENSQ